MTLTKEQRDALPDADFAVPGRRQLPIHDRIHAKMSWEAVSTISGLSDEERREARALILARAPALGLDVSALHVRGMRFETLEAMAIEVPKVPDHPNRVPFSGILTRLDEPSDRAPNGTNGKRVVLPKAAAEKALPSLLGMAVDMTDEFDGHNVKKKIGLITEATIDGDAIRIKGFFYAADFPTEVKDIQAYREQLGFSFEAQARMRSMDDDPLVIESCVFTGAAVLFRYLAAYTTTSLAAKAAGVSGEEDMDLKEIVDAVKALTASVDGLKGDIGGVKKEVSEIKAKAEAAATNSVEALVKPQVDALLASAATMEAAGMGVQAKQLRDQAADIQAKAKAGILPAAPVAAAAASGVDAKAIEAVGADVKALASTVKDLTTIVTDLKAAAVKGAEPPARKTLPPEITTLLAKGGLTVKAEGDGKLTVADVDKALAAAGVSGAQSMAAKMTLAASGHLPLN